MEGVMHGSMKKIVVMIALLCAAAGTAWAAQAVNESYPVASNAEVDVENLAGSLVFEGWSNDVVEVTGTLGDGVERLDVESDEEGLYIEVVFDEDYHGNQVNSTDLTIRLPFGASLSVETVSSSISVAGINGDVDLESVSGFILVTGSPVSMDVETVSGKIDLESAPAGTDVASVSGLIKIGSAAGDLDAENVSGDIVIGGGALDGADLETVSGNITCKAMPTGAGDVDMETMSGTLTLTVDEGMVAYYEISTFSGTIVNKIGPAPQRTSKYTPGQELSFNTGSGGPQISLTSFSGTVKLLTN
jgi:opacity protein-like surface antigen